MGVTRVRHGGAIGRASVIAGLLASLTAGGCASAPDRGGFGDVKTTVEQRTDQQLVWPAEEKGAVREKVDELLDTDLDASTVAQVALLNNAEFYAQVE